MIAVSFLNLFISFVLIQLALIFLQIEKNQLLDISASLKYYLTSESVWFGLANARISDIIAEVMEFESFLRFCLQLGSSGLTVSGSTCFWNLIIHRLTSYSIPKELQVQAKSRTISIGRVQRILLDSKQWAGGSGQKVSWNLSLSVGLMISGGISGGQFGCTYCPVGAIFQFITFPVIVANKLHTYYLRNVTLMYGNKQATNSKFFYYNYGEERLQLMSMSLLSSEGYSLQYDDSASMMAIGCSEGLRALFSVDGGKFISQTHSDSRIGVTCLRWRPQVHSKHKVLLMSDSDTVAEYLIPGNSQQWKHHEENNSVFALDYSPEGKHFATAGKDRNIRIYDEDSKKVARTLPPAEDNYLGHTNRIFSLKFVDDNTIISGGWDAMVNIWDVREEKCVRFITGPHISGDSIDYQDNQILVGSHNSTNPLQVYDFGTAKLVQNLQWGGSQGQTPRVFSARFSSFDKGILGAGCSGTNEFKLFRFDGTEYKPINKIANLKGGCYAMDFHPLKKQFALTDSSGNFCVFGYDIK